jgi:predicted small lipoprotein YifL
MPFAKHLRAVCVLLAGAAALAGCGQRGPLTLPDSAQPVERLDPNAAAPAGEPAEPDEDERSENAPARE